MDHYQKLKEVGYVGKNLGQEKYDFGDCGSFYGLFYALKMELCYIRNKYGTLNENKTFKNYHDIEMLLDIYEYFKLRDSESIIVH